MSHAAHHRFAVALLVLLAGGLAACGGGDAEATPTPPTAVATLLTSGPPPVLTATATATPAPTDTYTVVAGDTLSEIALRFGTTVAALAEANGIDDPSLIAVGQVLTLPASP